MTLKHRIGNWIEWLGHRIAAAGAPTLGQRIHDFGDRMEDSHKNVVHPHRA